MCSTRYSTLQLLYSCCLYMTSPLHDINCQLTNDDSNLFTLSCLLVQCCMKTTEAGRLPFFGLSQNRSPMGSLRSRLLWWAISCKGLSGSNKPHLLSALNTHSKWHCYSFYHHCETKCPHSRATCKMGLKEKKWEWRGYTLGRKGFWKTNKGIFSSLDHKCR